VTGRASRVAIVRLTSLGDVVHALPLAHALRRHDASLRVAWVVEEREQVLLHDNPAVDEVVVAPTRRWRAELRRRGRIAGVVGEWRAVRDRLRALRLDATIDVQGLVKSAHLAWLSRAPLRIGFGWSHVRDPLAPLFATCRVSPPPEAVHVVAQNLALLGPLGVKPGEVAFPLPRAPQAGERARAFLTAHGVRPGDRLVALLPATRGPAKQWPPAHFRALAGQLTRTAGARILAVGGPGEEPLLRAVAGELEGAPIISADAPVLDLLALLRHARLAVGNDTGPLHLAAAAGVPTVGLYGPTRAARNGPFGGQGLQSPTGRMADLPVGPVLAAAMAWLR
jgi:lipopolysaccharide heptosyltransferase I